MLNRWTCLLGGALSALTACGLALRAQAEDFQGSTHLLPFEESVIHYSQQAPTGAVERLQRQIDSGAVSLKFDRQFGYLPAVLAALKIPASSQMLVFSKTSLQRQLISPQNPRALFFNDDAYVGFIPGAPVMEISAVDPKLGGIFYSIEQTEVARPQITRRMECLQCHASPRTLGVPGHLIRSVGTDETGEMDLRTDISSVTQNTPMEERWGGWYVTGKQGDQFHRGNLVGEAAFTQAKAAPDHFGNETNLSRFFDVKKYPETGSDIVALLVLEHQVHMHNYITRLNFESQLMLSAYGHIRYLKQQVDAFLRYLLFTEETPLSGEIQGNPAFVREFARSGPRDQKGRSLRDFDLETRLFKYPCSFLIYSEAFDSLPGEMREHLLRRLYQILTGTETTSSFARLPVKDRRAVLEILRATKPNLPSYWREERTGGVIKSG